MPQAGCTEEMDNPDLSMVCLTLKEHEEMKSHSQAYLLRDYRDGFLSLPREGHRARRFKGHQPRWEKAEEESKSYMAKAQH